MSSFIRLRVFFLFVAGYFVSYLFRGINLGFAPLITHDLGLSAADLGLLTLLYFIGFALTQIPVGVLLDHFGLARMTATMLVFAAAGIWVFGAAHEIGGLMIGRFADWRGCVRVSERGVQGLGAAFSGGAAAARQASRWQSAGSAAWSWVHRWRRCRDSAVRAAQGGQSSSSRYRHAVQSKGTWHILKSGAFWKIASFSVVTQGVFYAMQSLWIRPYLLDVMNLTPTQASALVSVLGFAMMFGSVGFGAASQSTRFAAGAWRCSSSRNC